TAVDADVAFFAEDRDLAVVGPGRDIDVLVRGEAGDDGGRNGRHRVPEAAVVRVAATAGRRRDEDRVGLVAVDAVAVGVDEAEVGLVDRTGRAGGNSRDARRDGEQAHDGQREGDQDREATREFLHVSMIATAGPRNYGARRHPAGGKPTPAGSAVRLA